MTYKENIKAILECYFTGFKEEIIDSACNRILEQEPCDDAISRVETVKFLANHSNEFEDEKIRMAFQSASSLVNNPHNLPPVQPQPKTGHWILTSDDDLEYCTCSECGYQNGENWMIGSQIKFCQECGAKMQESEEV